MSSADIELEFDFPEGIEDAVDESEVAHKSEYIERSPRNRKKFTESSRRIPKSRRHISHEAVQNTEDEQKSYPNENFKEQKQAPNIETSSRNQHCPSDRPNGESQ
eukprot:212746_1